MAGSINRNKVARAARTGGGRRRDTSSAYGWYATMLIVTILGASLVAYSRYERLHPNDNSGGTPPRAPSAQGAGDRWFEAYGIYICDKFVDPIKNDKNPYGLGTQGDGIIHITPFEKKYAGHNATFGLFAKAMDLKADDKRIQLPGDSKVYDTNAKCGDKPGEVVTKQWSNAADAKTGKLSKGDPGDIRLKNNAALVVAFVPRGETNIPLPISAAKLPEVAAADAANQQQDQQSQSTATPTTAPSSASTTASTTTAPTTAPSSAPTTSAAPK